ncbi:MAG TPA: DUF6600 domain-containing protein [Stellaceae bacterium]|nr:DUF6600 domain-containing protein [Stellaceae bacterium]
MAGQGWAADSTSPIVGRISATDGTVLYHSPEGAWAPALVNEPVATGSGVRTAAGAEAEWRSPGARVALAAGSELRVLRLDETALQLALTNGRIGIHLDKTQAAETVEIDLPRGGVWLDKPGEYDIIAGDANTAPTIRVFGGEAHLGGGLDDRIFADGSDSFSEWWRSQNDSANLTAQQGWTGITGTTALAGAGRWEHDWKWGDVWFPSDVAIEWAPYRDGVWRHLPPWGWTWIDRAAWGFTSSHYGRWVRLDDRWGWVPGKELHPADYSPAAVAFLGTAGIGLSRPGDIGAAPAVAWFPLAPEETVGDADGAYKNRRFATAVPRAAFTAGLAVADTMIEDIPKRRFVEAPVILDALSIAPDGVPAGKRAPVPSAAVPLAPAAADARQPFVVALRDAPPPRPVQRETRKEARKETHKETHRRVRIAILVPRSRPLASAARSPHNRAHLAAARGGA